MDKKHKTGYTAIVGAPNAGKSTLLNALLKQKISIVTPKPQTTRQRVVGILTQEDAQIIFLDTPGLITAKYLLHQEMLKQAENAIQDADVVLFLIDASKKDFVLEDIYERIRFLCNDKPIFLLINKIDKIGENELKLIISNFSTGKKFKDIIPISALKHDNLDILIEKIIQCLPEHEALYPDDIISEHPERFFVAEIIREKIFNKYREEIPYSIAVEIREFKEREEAKTRIIADIIVERDSQKGIVIGKKGEALKEIGILARKDIEKFIQREIFLQLFVKVRHNWRDNENMIRQYGYKSKNK